MSSISLAEPRCERWHKIQSSTRRESSVETSATESRTEPRRNRSRGTTRKQECETKRSSDRGEEAELSERWLHVAYGTKINCWFLWQSLFCILVKLHRKTYKPVLCNDLSDFEGCHVSELKTLWNNTARPTAILHPLNKLLVRSLWKQQQQLHVGASVYCPISREMMENSRMFPATVTQV